MARVLSYGNIILDIMNALNNVSDNIYLRLRNTQRMCFNDVRKVKNMFLAQVQC